MNRPMGLRAVGSIGKACPGLNIIATGGVSSADSAVQYFNMGASAVQVCSAIQNQDFTVIDDYLMGLKCHLYMLGRLDLATWNKQSPPTVYGNEIRIDYLKKINVML